MNLEVRESRLKLREIYSKYVQELYEVVSKIDKSLELIEQNDKNENR